MRTLTVTIYCYEDDSSEEFNLPARWDLCDNCDGEGEHLTGSLRNVAFSREDFEEDPDFAKSYFNGTYDVMCKECNGSGKVLVVDEEALTPEQKTIYNIWLKQEFDLARDRAMDRRTYMLECGYHD